MSTIPLIISLALFPGLYIYESFSSDGFLHGLSTMLGWIGIFGVVGGVLVGGSTFTETLVILTIGLLAYYASHKLLSHLERPQQENKHGL